MIAALFRIIAPFGIGKLGAQLLTVGAIVASVFIWYKAQLHKAEQRGANEVISKLQRDQNEIDSIADEARERIADELANNGVRGDNFCRDC